MDEIITRPSLEQIQDGEAPDASELRANPRLYRAAVIETLVAAMNVTLALNDQVRATAWGADAEAKFRHALRTEPTAALEKKLYAIQAQNPGVLVQAMQGSGFEVKSDADGAVRIDYKGAGDNLAGRHVSPEEFEAL